MQQEKTAESSKRHTHFVGCLLFIVALVVLAATILGSIYLSQRTHRLEQVAILEQQQAIMEHLRAKDAELALREQLRGADMDSLASAPQSTIRPEDSLSVSTPIPFGHEPMKLLTEEQVVSFARLALNGIDREFPNKPSNVMVDQESVQSPREMHPAFFGCFDWHSAVHGHWLLVRLLKQYPNNALAQEIRQCLAAHLTAEKIAAEAAYFTKKNNRLFERMYGWAWALRLVAELKTWDDPQGREWAAALAPLETVLIERCRVYLPNLHWPIRTGVHQDTAFALAQILDYARLVGDERTQQLVVQRSRDFYQGDNDYPVKFEPSGEDFFSSGLNEADLMRRVLSPAEFTQWLTGFFPTLNENSLGNLLKPAAVSDITDGKLVHLAGLNFNRAWTMRGIASCLPRNSASAQLLNNTARRHLEAGLEYVFSGQYEGEHWLATFAVYVLTDTGLKPL